MLRRGALLLPLIMVLLGCITQQTATRFKGNNTGSNEMIFGFSQEMLDMMKGMGGAEWTQIEQVLQDPSELTESMPAAWKARGEPWTSDDEQFTGFRITTEFSTLQMLEEQLLNTSMGESTSSLFKAAQVQRTGETYTIKATVNLNDDSGEMNAEDMQMMSGMSGSDMTPLITWRIEMPGGITQWNEREIAERDGNAIIYTFPFDSTRPYTIVVSGKATGGVPEGAMLAISGLALAGVTCIAIGLLLNQRQRRAMQPAPMAAPFSAAPPLASPQTSWTGATVNLSEPSGESRAMPTRPLGGTDGIDADREVPERR